MIDLHITKNQIENYSREFIDSIMTSNITKFDFMCLLHELYDNIDFELYSHCKDVNDKRRVRAYTNNLTYKLVFDAFINKAYKIDGNNIIFYLSRNKFMKFLKSRSW